jgi:hypothetical protein
MELTGGHCTRSSVQGGEIGCLHSNDLSAAGARCVAVQQLLIGREESVTPVQEITLTELTNGLCD